MNVEDLTEKSAKEILDAISHRLGKFDFQVHILNDDASPKWCFCTMKPQIESQFPTESNYLYVKEDNLHIRFDCHTYGKHPFKDVLAAILHEAATGHDVIFFYNIEEHVFVKKYATLESILVELDLNGFKIF